MNAFKCFGIAAVLASMTVCGTASALTINFDPQGGVPAGDLPAGIVAMGNSPGAAVPVAAELSNQYEPDGVLFSSTLPYIAVVSGAVASSPNAIGGVNGSGGLSYADPVIFTFVLPGSTTAGVTGNISIQADETGIPGQYATLRAYDVNGVLLDSETLNDVGSEVWSINIAGIHTARFDFPTTISGDPTTGSPNGSGTGIALDNLTFGAVGAVGTSGGIAVPLPPMVWSSLLMLGLLGGVRMLRRRAYAV